MTAHDEANTQGIAPGANPLISGVLTMAYATAIRKMVSGILGAYELQAHDRLVRDTGHVFTAAEICHLDAYINRRFNR